MNKPIESVIIKEEDAEVWSDEEQRFVLNAVSNFYVLLATGDRCYYKTRDRKLAQEQANIDWDSKYTVRAVKDQKSRSRQENGEVSVRGSNTRKCFSPRLKGLK